MVAATAWHRMYWKFLNSSKTSHHKQHHPHDPCLSGWWQQRQELSLCTWPRWLPWGCAPGECRTMAWGWLDGLKSESWGLHFFELRKTLGSTIGVRSCSGKISSNTPLIILFVEIGFLTKKPNNVEVGCCIFGQAVTIIMLLVACLNNSCWYGSNGEKSCVLLLKKRFCVSKLKAVYRGRSPQIFHIVGNVCG